MGIIKRQSIKKAIVNYLGVGIGAISTLFIFPHAPEAVGLIKWLLSVALLSLPLANLGASILAVKFFPEFENDKNAHNGLLGLLVSITFAGFLFYLLLVFLFSENIQAYYSQNAKQNQLLYLPFAIPLTFLYVQVYLLTAYTSNFKRVVVPTIINDTLHKLGVPVLILLFLGGILVQTSLIYALICLYLVNVVLILGYLYWLRELKFRINLSFLTRERVRRMGNYASFSILGALGGLLAVQLDIFMVGSLIDDNQRSTGIYTIALFISNTIEIPMRAIFSIASPIVSKAWQHNDLEEIISLYSKTSLNLLIAGLAIFGLIWLNIDDLLNLIPKGEVIREGKYVILFIGLARIVDLGTSINGFIINYSKYYRFSLYVLIILAVSNILLTLYLIPRYGITGAALATFISLFLYNSIKVGFIWFRFKIHPFSFATIQVLLLALVGYFLAWLIPDTSFSILNMVVNTLVYSIFFGGLVLGLKISPDINLFVNQILAWFGIKPNLF